jgi:hypothetical protein
MCDRASVCAFMCHRACVCVCAHVALVAQAARACDGLRSRYPGDSIRIATYSDYKALNLGSLCRLVAAAGGGGGGGSWEGEAGGGVEVGFKDAGGGKRREGVRTGRKEAGGRAAVGCGDEEVSCRDRRGRGGMADGDGRRDHGGSKGNGN